MNTKDNHITAYILLALCVLFWSCNFIIGRYLHDELSPITLAFYRWLGVFLVVLPYLIMSYKTIFQAIKEHFIHLSILSILSVSCYNTFLYIGLQDTLATNALLINSVFPILVIILASFILKTKITAYQALGIFCSTIGVVFLVLKGNLSQITHFQFNKGDGFIILASLSWALYSVLLRLQKVTLKPLQFITSTVTLGFLYLCPFYFFSSQDFAHDLVKVQEHGEFIFFIVLFPSLLSYIFWNRGILEIGADKTGQFTHLMPIFGAVLAFVFLDEMPKLYHILGILFIFSGIYFSLFFKRKV